jgi:hypothetical protein
MKSGIDIPFQNDLYLSKKICLELVKWGEYTFNFLRLHVPIITSSNKGVGCGVA